MKTFFGSLRHVFAISNKEQILWCALVLITMILLAILHHRWRYDDKKMKIWRLLCLTPLAIAAAHFVLYAATFPLIATAFLPVYVPAVLALIPIIFAKRRVGYPVTATLVGILSGICGLYYLFQAPQVDNFARQSYTESFHSFVQTLDEKYVLKEWKEIDFAALEAKYLPLVEEAEKEHDPSKFAYAVTMFSSELHDGHVWTDAYFDPEVYTYGPSAHEYGLAMIQLDNGDTIAVCTAEEVHKLGIEDGTVITKWNGKTIDEAKEDVAPLGYPVKSNEDRLSVIYLSGVGGETVDVTFVDESGEEQTVTLSELGEMHTLREALETFAQRPYPLSDEGQAELIGSNFGAKMITDNCGYLILSAEETGNAVQDMTAYLSGDHKWAREMFREKLRDLKAEGMEYLVVDIRNNLGGTDVIGAALTSLLTEEDYYCHGLGIRKNGEYKSVSDHYIYADGEFADLKVVVLTNYLCASAGDGAAYYLSRLPNVTLAGITDPNGCNQVTGGVIVLSEGVAAMGYPVGPVLNEDGEPNIDTAADRISRDPVEERIPLNYDAAMRLFHDKEDYELDWAIRYLARQ